MRTLLLICSLLLAAGALQAQKECNYAKLMAEGNAFFKKQNFRAALKKFNAARTCDASQSKAVDDAINRLFDSIEAQRDEAKAQRDEAQKQRKRAEAAQKLAENEKQRADAQIVKNQRLIDAFYFYGGRLALAYRNDRFGFIDKEGKVVIGYRYEKAEQFDELGFAKVRMEGHEYLIDTFGNEYKAAYDLENLNKSVTALDLRKASLDSFPKAIFEYPRLKILIMGKESWEDAPNFDTLPPGIGKLQDLQFLDLAHLGLTALPIEIGNLKSLQYLDLNENNLEALPAEIGGLESLTSLYLYGNQLKALPKEIGGLQLLKNINLAQNALPSLPDGFWQLQNLKYINLGGNYLQTLSEKISGLQNLEELHLFLNQFSKLPAAIGKLKNLKTLDLSENKFTTLPLEIWELKNLEKLYLGDNQLKVLPAEIGGLKMLECLFLSSNQLEVLPVEIGGLKNLQFLYLDHNRIAALPAQTSALKNLKNLSLYGNNKLDAASVLRALRGFPGTINFTTDEYGFSTDRTENSLLLILDKQMAETKEVKELRKLKE